jgi:hypothetical protein
MPESKVKLRKVTWDEAEEALGVSKKTIIKYATLRAEELSPEASEEHLESKGVLLKAGGRTFWVGTIFGRWRIRIK